MSSASKKVGKATDKVGGFFKKAASKASGWFDNAFGFVSKEADEVVTPEGIRFSSSDFDDVSDSLKYSKSSKVSSNTIRWSLSVVSNAAKDLERGATVVTVANRSQAEELFLRMFQGKGYTNVTGMTAMESKNLLHTKANTYHWDDVFGKDGFLLGHGGSNPDAKMAHLQIHPENGNVIRIFFKN